MPTTTSTTMRMIWTTITTKRTKKTKTTKRTTKTTNNHKLAPLLCAALILAGALTTLAQKPKPEDANTRSLKGIVFDADTNPVEQAVVQLKDSRTLQVMSFITKQDGEYHFANLRKDVEYQVKADRQGLTSDWKRLSIFDDRKVAEINLKLVKKEEPPKP